MGGWSEELISLGGLAFTLDNLKWSNNTETFNSNIIT